jgi:dTDP-glucose 4,6-dehydratase
MTVQGDGSQSRTLCYVTDILDGFEAVISRGEPGEIYNLGSDDTITIKEFAELVMKLANSSSTINYVPRPHHDHSSRMPVLDKIKALGWESKVDLETGLRHTIADFQRRLVSQNEYSSTNENLQLQPQV